MQNDEALLRGLSAQYGDVAEQWRRMPLDEPLPMTPQMIDLITELVLTLHGPALKELEKH